MQTTASNDIRPCSLQYTSSSRTHSANSSTVNPTPTPKQIAVRCHHGASSGAAKARKPDVIISKIPMIRWW